MNNDEVMDFVSEQVGMRAAMTETALPEAGDALLRESLTRGSRDNMTTLILALSSETGKIRHPIEGKALDFSSV